MVSTIEVELGLVFVGVRDLEEIELVEYALHFILPVLVMVVTFSPEEVTVEKFRHDVFLQMAVCFLWQLNFKSSALP